MAENLSNTHKFIAVGVLGGAALMAAHSATHETRAGEAVTMHQLSQPEEITSTAEPFNHPRPFPVRPKRSHASRSLDHLPLPPARPHHRVVSRHHKVAHHAIAHSHPISHARSIKPVGSYWYGPPSELEAMGEDQKHNAELAYTLAMEQWKSTTEVSCLDNLWFRESAFHTHDANPSSGADGIPQALPASKMAKFGEDWRTNPVTQERWGIWYITGRYVTACAAWQHSQEYNWY